jgi:hypothetical protein
MDQDMDQQGDSDQAGFLVHGMLQNTGVPLQPPVVAQSFNATIANVQ